MKARQTQTQASSVAEYIKIRKHVVTLVLKAGKKETQIPSNRELERKFGVSRPTVQRALAELVDSGFLIAKPGIGTFTNPRAELEGFQHCKRIGLLVGDGKISLYDRFTWKFSNCVATHLLDSHDGYCLQPLNLLESGERVFEEIRNLELSGLLWAFPSPDLVPLIRRLKEESGIPLVSVGRPVEGVSSYSLDYERSAYETVKLFLQEGRQEKFLFVYYSSHPGMKAGLAGARRACEEAGCDFGPRQAIDVDAETLDNLEHALNLGFVPQGVVAWALGPQLASLFIRKGVDFKKDCRFMANNWVLPAELLREGMLLCRNDYEALGRLASESLVRQCEGGQVEKGSLVLPFTIERVEKGGLGE